MKNDKDNSKLIYFRPIGRIALIFFIGFSVYLIISTIMLIFLTKPAREVRIPDVEGKRFVDVYNSLANSGIRPHLTLQSMYDVEDGIILSQYPEKGRIVPENSTFKLVLSSNKCIIDMPNLIGSNLPHAINSLKSIHYRDKKVAIATGIISYIPSDKVQENIVIDQDPKAGQKITPGTKINFLVSSGSKDTNTTIPEVTGQSIELCTDLLLAKGLVINQEIVPTNDIKNSGIILSQNPQKGAPFKKGDSISLRVQWYPLYQHHYSAYEKVEYTIPHDEEEGLYEAYIEDSNPKRVRFSHRMRPGQVIQFVFERNGNADITIVCNKRKIEVMDIEAED